MQSPLFEYQYQQMYPETNEPGMYDETHKIQLALITKCNLYTNGSLFTLLYLSIKISRCIQKSTELEWYTCKPGMYAETHQI